MKYLVTVLAVLLTLGFIGTADAFHGGGVAHCDGCHSMHNSADNPISGAENTTLLKGTDESSTCLNCHAGAGGYHIADATGVSNTNGGGDFGWIKNPYFLVIRGNVSHFGGDNAGHNIVAVDFGYSADGTNTQAPGGDYTATGFACTSCHDAHGQVLGGTAEGSDPISVSGSYGGVPVAGTIAGNYRLLGDTFYDSSWTADAPIARTTNGASYGADTAYGTGMSEWCANCHTAFIGTTVKHVSGAATGLLNGAGDNYNSYVKTGDFTGSQLTSYDELIPFETGQAKADLDPASTAGPDGIADAVMCLTCHRAHASAHNNAGRWDLETEYIAESHAIETTNLPSTAAIYYDSTGTIDVVARYGQYQRSLCNKCHVQD